MPTEALRMSGITKRFGRLVANDHVDLRVNENEIMALLGENGAGKSTLMNILSGVYQPNEGEIYLWGKRVAFPTPRDALLHGVGMIYQHFKLVDNMTALENIVEANNTGVFLNRKKAREKILALCEKTGLACEPDKYVYDMSISEKQTLEILKVLYCDVKLLILDEPTAVLTPQEADKLFDVLRNMKALGHSVVLITHKLNEIMRVSDRVTVLRGGKNVGLVNTADADPKSLTNLMVGATVELSSCCAPRMGEEVVIEARGLTLLDKDKVPMLDDVSFQIHRGEILGVAGLAGSGQKPLCEIMSGILKLTTGDVLFNGQSAVDPHTRKVSANRLRVGFVPENRLGMGLVGNFDMVDNLMLREQDNQRGLFLNRKPCRKQADELIAEIDIKTQGPNFPVKLMSGGNIQKLMVGREMKRDIDFFVAAYPVRGLDMSSIYFVYNMIEDIKAKGIPVLLIGEDLDHLKQFTNRILVLCGGRVMGTVYSAATTREELGEMMAGNRLEKERWIS